VTHFKHHTYQHAVAILPPEGLNPNLYAMLAVLSNACATLAIYLCRKYQLLIGLYLTRV